MENKQGNVETISQQNNACQIDGVWYTLGPKVKISYVKKGPCEYSVEQTPEGQNDLVVFIKTVGSQQQQQPQSQSQPTDEGMKRMSALKASSRIYAGTGQEEDFKRLTNEIKEYIDKGIWKSEQQV